MKENDLSSQKITTEATSFLDLQLVDFLASSQVLAAFYPLIYQFNSKLIRKFKKAYSDKEKPDKINVFMITDRLRSGRLSGPDENHQPYLSLRRLTRYRFHFKNLDKIVEALERAARESYKLTDLPSLPLST